MPLKPTDDSEDRSLRHVEENVLIPQIIRKRAAKLCNVQAQKFFDCCKGRTVSAAWACRAEVKMMNDCLAKYYTDPAFFEECKESYLAERAHFRKTGVNPNRVNRRRGRTSSFESPEQENTEQLSSQ
ncbi:COX assembly mitochondrial protein-like protein [Trichoplax sp. H2]|uniref:COX assembly mitochondrial protein n=1 Tax=Trichoplax adhaerens TaxID=10228 RepID=B3SA19_TRIAD|nr:hypothetical protein TRIADDRAFT_61103 [Trichoplax adhaerens]EDV20363.1 hypothetical protein TRIADDRAFT_61103 [Trichoplax adhaerens]RDD39523.1 COX assembly mitochondrial protein-like protein [Trichoplax sp. H2]|eukprot:XP_002117057.1 hypothetical protein TRIADDRAFT_61103 [Trichoplax adhaerens]